MMNKFGGIQSKLDQFVSKKTKGASHQQNDKSKKNMDLITFDESTEQTQVQLEVFSKHTTHKAYEVCVPMLLIGPSDTIIYQRSIKPKLESLFSNFSKQNLLKLILHNMRFHQVENIQNLKEILSDNVFCNITVHELLFLLIKEVETISSQIRLLSQCQNQIVELSRKQILLIMASMFFGICPKQLHQNNTTFGNLMQRDKNEYFNHVRIEKLRCIASYFNSMLGCLQKDVQVLDQKIQIRRTFLTTHIYQDCKQNLKMRKVDVRSLDEEGIQDYYCKGIMVDFANKKIGGGVLNNGCVQEQILFSIFPELIIAKLLCFGLEDTEAITVHGARRFCYFEGYRQSFRFTGSCFQDYLASDYQQSLFVAIDAYDFNYQNKSNYRLEQYSKRGIKRELFKALTGFKGTAIYTGHEFPICTGRWGCGAFGGDEDLKFMIQWVACSLAARDMVYITKEQKKIVNYRCLVRYFRNETTNGILEILEEYCSFRQRIKTAHQPSLLQFIKNIVI